MRTRGRGFRVEHQGFSNLMISHQGRALVLRRAWSATRHSPQINFAHALGSHPRDRFGFGGADGCRFRHVQPLLRRRPSTQRRRRHVRADHGSFHRRSPGQHRDRGPAIGGVAQLLGPRAGFLVGAGGCIVAASVGLMATIRRRAQHNAPQRRRPNSPRLHFDSSVIDSMGEQRSHGKR